MKKVTRALAIVRATGYTSNMNCTATGIDLEMLEPAVIDQMWAEVEDGLAPTYRELAETRKSIARYGKWGRVPSYLTDRQETLEQRLADAKPLLDPFTAEWERRAELNGTRYGWTRYHRCTSDGGHIHRLPCHTLTPGRTTVVLVPELTDLSEAEMVAQVGFAACTHCFPEAPTMPAWIAGQQAAEADEAAKKATRCPGSSKQAKKFINNRYGVCSECGQTMGVSTYGIIRTHKPAAK